MIASLSMYARKETDPALARFWELIRTALASRGIAAPAQLAQAHDLWRIWQDPAMVLSQTCGMPYRQKLHDHVQLVGTLDYGLAGCPPGYYRSAFVVRADDPRTTLAAYRDGCFAFNEVGSGSGFGAAYAHAAGQGVWFSTFCETGAHVASARAVAEGRADIASLDAQTWRLITGFDDDAQALRVLEWTKPDPGLPLITSKGQDRRQIYKAVEEAINLLKYNDKETLGLKGIVAIPAVDYLAVPNPPDQALP